MIKKFFGFVFLTLCFVACSGVDGGNGELDENSSSNADLSESSSSSIHDSGEPGTESSSSAIETGNSDCLPEMLSLTPGSDQTELHFTWYSNAEPACTASLVEILQNDALLMSESGKIEIVSDAKISHKVKVQNLAADTRYQYRVSGNGLSWSGTFSFKTPGLQSFKFAALTDAHVKTGEQDAVSAWFSADRSIALGWKTVTEKIAAAQVSLMVSAGDQVDKNEGDENEYAAFFAPEALRSIPLVPVTGNHDKSCLFRYHFYLPNEQNLPAACEGFRSVETAGDFFYLYNNVLFVGLNTSNVAINNARATELVERFDTVIEKAKRENQGKFTWLVVTHHKSTASIADHVAEPEIQRYVEAGFEKLMDKHQVDFVIAGHDHVYARTSVMRGGGNYDEVMQRYTGGEIVDTSKENISLTGNPGTIYLTLTTASGAKYNELFNKTGKLYGRTNPYYPYLVNGLFGAEAYMAGNLPLSTLVGFQDYTPGYAIFEVNGNTVSYSYYEADKDLPVDYFVATK
ncbi:MAG: metallophosphoesterase [Fibrobacter sp.]|jgi:predicted phosphodiesterase|nr:metallophosphoesterase [Fibrobacter sp.]